MVATKSFIPLSEISEDIVAYMSGYVLKMINNRNLCDHYLEAIHSEFIDEQHQNFKFIHRRNRVFSITVFSATTMFSLKCEICNKSFATLSIKRQHIRRLHPDSLEILPSTKYKLRRKFEFPCKFCTRNFKGEKNLNIHVKKAHSKVINMVKERSQLNKKCPLCMFALPSGTKDTEMFKHFHEDHHLLIIENELEFQSADEFDQWLPQEEKATNSRYVKKNTRKYQHEIQINYMCHRSGYYKPEGLGLRAPKLQGSVKINAFCPAGIRLSKDPKTGHCKIRYINTHVGHSIEDDIGHMWLSKADREEIANEIACGIPFEDILNKYNSKTQNEKVHFLTRKDLNNIRQQLLKSGHNRPVDKSLIINNLDLDKQVFHTKIDNPTINKKIINTLEEEKEDLKKYLMSVIDSVDSPQKLEELKAVLDPLFSIFPSVVVKGPLDVQFFIKS